MIQKFINLFSKTVLKHLTANRFIKILFLLFSFSVFLRLILNFFNNCDRYIIGLNIILWRLFFILSFVILIPIFNELSFIKSTKEELRILNTGPKHTPASIRFLKKYEYLLLFLGGGFYSLSMYVLITHPLSSNLFGLLSFISFFFFFLQFVYYTTYYIHKSFFQATKPNKFSGQKNNTPLDSVKKSSTAAKIVVVCWIAAKGVVAFVPCAELTYKLTHGGMNDVSPWRQYALNRAFPDDPTKVWSESKAALATHKKAMGITQSDIKKC